MAVEVERHPFEPFLPEGAKVLMLGSFPPQKKRWSMEFYYPNFINDFWRIIGLLFFEDKDWFVDKVAKKFKLQEINPCVFTACLPPPVPTPSRYRKKPTFTAGSLRILESANYPSRRSRSCGLRILVRQMCLSH